MMPMHFPCGNNNPAGQHIYGPTVCPPFGLNYNQYFTSFYSNSNGHLPTPIINQNNIPKPLMSKTCVTTNSQPRPLLMPYEEKHTINSDDFLTFIDQKANKSISELNPFANEFSLVKSTKTTTTEENTSSYRLIFDNLIEQSLQSIEAIKKASKTIPINHVATQCQQSIDQINRSTQTNDDHDQHKLLEEYSFHTVKLMNNLLENFRYLFLLSTKNGLHNQLKSMSYIFDELHYLIYTINQMILSNKSSMKRDNLFSNMIKDLSIPSSPIIFGNKERTHRLISSTPLVFSRQIDPITIDRSKLCLLCQKPVDDNDDDMHELCRLLSSPPPNRSFNI